MQPSLHETQSCPLCGTHFTCKVNNIAHCDCQTLALDRPTLDYIQQHYTGCLCNACLRRLQRRYQHMKLPINERMAASRTSVFKVVFPNTTNHYDTLFGGTALQWMDEVAFIAATRFCRQRVVTVSTSQIDFKKPIPADTIVELVAEVVRIGTTSLDIRVSIFCEQMYDTAREQAIEGLFTFVAVDEHKQPVAIV